MMPVTLAAVIERRAGHLAHQAEAAAAVDEADVVRGQLCAERPCGGRVGRIFAEAGAAVDADAAYAGQAYVRRNGETSERDPRSLASSSPPPLTDRRSCSLTVALRHR